MLQRAVSLKIIAGFLAFLASVFFLTNPVFAAGNKYALLIGINQYQSIPSLSKAVGDARVMASTLQSLGFEVTLVENPDRRTLNRAIARFRNKLKPGDTAFVHYSGHGIEINGRNYLLAADIPKPTTAAQDEIEGEAFSVATLINRIASTGASVRIFVLDACRDNPFATSGTRGVGGKRGLTREKVTAGTFVFYSAGYGQSALDNLGPADTTPTSVYTRVLAEKLLRPYKHVAKIARDVRRKVEKLALSVGHIQRPAYYDELSDDFCLVCEASSKAKKQQLSPPSAGLPSSGPLSSGSLTSRSGRNGKADLVIRSVEFKPTGKCKARRPVMNGRIEVENIGTAPAGTKDNPVIVSIHDTHSKAAKWGNGTRLGIVEPGQTRTGYFPLYYFTGLPGHVPGLHEFEVTVDPKKTVDELNEENNKAYGEVEIKCPAGRNNIAANDNTPQKQDTDNQNALEMRTAALPKGGPKSYWDHNGSLMYLTAEGRKRAFFYQNPRRVVREAGVRNGTLLFYGKKVGRRFFGRMRQFSKYCGTIEYNVFGRTYRDFKGIRVEVTSKKVPVRSKKNCSTIGYKKESYTFTFLNVASAKAKEKTKPDNIVQQVPRFKKIRHRQDFDPFYPDEPALESMQTYKKSPLRRNINMRPRYRMHTQGREPFERRRSGTFRGRLGR